MDKCEPEVVNSYREFDCFDEDGRMETTLVHEYNCQFCDDEECKYWKEWNE